MLNQLNTTTKRELDSKYLSEAEISDLEDKLQGSKQITNTSGTLSIPDYGMTESIELYFKPTQDLHGYDKPWAGGAGKNKLVYPFNNTEPSTINGVTFTPNSDGTITVNGTASSEAVYNIHSSMPIPDGTYILSGAKSGNKFLGLNYFDSDTAIESTRVDTYTTEGATFTSHKGIITYIQIVISRGQTVTNEVFYPMLRLATETDPTFEPYANICSIIGQDKALLTWNTNQGISMNFGTTYYGGIANFEGVLSLDWQRIASYDGESLPGEWVSDRDAYASGTTPSTGAEVVYKTTPSTVRVTRPASLNLTDDYPITYNGYKLDVTYQPKDTILEEAKSYTNEEIAKLGIPQPPISNGTYNLVCTVASGIPTLSWESTT